MKKNTLIVLSLILIICTIFTIYYIIEKENPSNENIAIVTFHPSNDTQISFTCEIASNPQERSEGLMFRTELSEKSGMLFIFEESKNVSFWMKNVLIPLDIIFINETGEIINIEIADIQPDTPDNELIRYNSLKPVKYVIEINQGLTKSYSIEKGTKVTIEYK